MGYFSNGVEGMDYEGKYCARCVHGQDPDFGAAACPVMECHSLWNYEQGKNEVAQSVLSFLIPREGVANAQCRMFVEAPRVVCAGREEVKP